MTEERDLSREELKILKEKYEKLLFEDPSSVAFIFLGEILRKLGELGRATDVLIGGLRHHPENVTGRLILGKIYYDRWMIDEAKREIEEVIKSAPDNLAASKILIQIYRSEGKLEKALELCQSAYFFNPQDDEIRNSIQEINEEIALAQEKNIELLLAEPKKDEFRELPTEEDSESFSEFFEQEIYTETMADLYMNQGLYERAIRVFEKLLEYDPKNQSLQTKLERARTHLGR